MKIHKSQSSTFIYILILFFICILSFLIINTPGIRGDIEQSLRIFFKQPVLLKSERIKKIKLLIIYIKFITQFKTSIRILIVI